MKKSVYWFAILWLRFWARLALRRIKPYIVGVTGSAGKSSAVAAIAPILKLKFKAVKVAKKANSESGIPADILGLHFGESAYPLLDWLRILLLAPLHAAHSVFSIQHSVFDCYLVEMGIDEPTPPKNMGYLLTILQPDVGVILNALPVHVEQFERTAKRPNLGARLPARQARQGWALIDSIATEKGKLITQNQNLKSAILNADQPELISLSSNVIARSEATCLPARQARQSRSFTLTFGKKSEADIKILSIKPSLASTEILLQYNKQKYFIKLNRLALPDFYAYTFAASFAVGISLGLKPDNIIKAISAGFILPPGRGQIFKGIKNSIIIDSSYNASGETMMGSLRLLKTIAGKRRKIAVSGDMRELGNQAEKEHLAVAKTILETVDEAILVGPLTRQFVLPYLQKHDFPARWFASAGEAAKFAKPRGGEVILVKGSQNTIFLEIVIEALLSNKADVKKLCRRGKFWDKQRRPYC